MRMSEYIEKRNGAPLGASQSLRNMMNRSLGAGQFSTFWIYWNPIWGYYLGKYIFKPLKVIFSPALSLNLTFIFCGFLHDVVIMLIRWEITLLFTPWFFIMGIFVVIGDFIKLDYSSRPWMVRAIINVAIIAGCYMLSRQLGI